MGYARGGHRGWLAILLLVLCVPSLALADGKVFPRTAVATIPDQEALIHYADGVETLVVETRFVGEGNDFAWVVPTPSVPEVSEVTTGLFPALRSIVRPHLIDQITPFAWHVAGIAVLVLGLHFKRGWLAIGLIITGGVFTVAILLPSLGRTRGGLDEPAIAGKAVTVHSRSLIGAFDVSVISSEDPDGLLDWLKDNDYRVSDEAADAIGAYVKDGWSFAAAKLHREQTIAEPSTPHPLAFRFATEKPVYPLRLTGAGNGKCSIGLFVFGDRRAAAPGFQVERCNTCWYSTEGETDPRVVQSQVSGVPIVHPQILKLVDKAPVVTHLTAGLDPDEMQDAYLSWEPYHPTRITLYSMEAARRLAAHAAASIIMIGLVLLIVSRKEYGMSGRSVTIGGMVVALVGMGTGGMLYGSLDKAQAAQHGMLPMLVESAHRSIGYRLQERMRRSKRDPRRLDDVVIEIEAMLKEEHYRERFGFEFNSGDEPLQYQLRASERGMQYIWYDRWGGEHVEDLIPRSASQPQAATQP